MNLRAEQLRAIGGRQLRLIVLVGTLLLTLCMWAISVPRGSTPDEGYHLASIWCARGEIEGKCQPLDRTEVLGSIVLTPYVSDFCFNRSPDLPANCVNELTDSTLVGHQRFDGKDFRILYYLALNPLSNLGPEIGVTMMRFVNIMIFVLLFASLLFFGTNQVSSSAAIGLLMTLVPQGLYLISSVNPSSWAVTAVGLNWAFLLEARSAQTTRRRAFFAACWALTTTLSLARLDSFGLLLFSTVAVIVFDRRASTTRNKRLGISLFVVIAMIYFAHQFDLLRILLTSIRTTFLDQRADFFIYWILHLIDIPAFSYGFNFEDFGALGGSLEILLPTFVPIIMSGLFITLLCWTFRNYSWRLVVFGASSIIFLFLVLIQQLAAESTYNPYWVQGRYILPFISFFLGFSVYLSLQGHSSSVQLFTAKLTSVGISVAHSLVLLTVIQRYSVGSNKKFVSILDSTSWNYVPYLGGIVVWLVGTVAFAIFAWLLSTAVVYKLDELRFVEASVSTVGVRPTN